MHALSIYLYDNKNHITKPCTRRGNASFFRLVSRIARRTSSRRAGDDIVTSGNLYFLWPPKSTYSWYKPFVRFSFHTVTITISILNQELLEHPPCPGINPPSQSIRQPTPEPFSSLHHSITSKFHHPNRSKSKISPNGTSNWTPHF